MTAPSYLVELGYLPSVLVAACKEEARNKPLTCASLECLNAWMCLMTYRRTPSEPMADAIAKERGQQQKRKEKLSTAQAQEQQEQQQQRQQQPQQPQQQQAQTPTETHRHQLPEQQEQQLETELEQEQRLFRFLHFELAKDRATAAAGTRYCTAVEDTCAFKGAHMLAYFVPGITSCLDAVRRGGEQM